MRLLPLILVAVAFAGTAEAGKKNQAVAAPAASSAAATTTPADKPPVSKAPKPAPSPSPPPPPPPSVSSPPPPPPPPPSSSPPPTAASISAPLLASSASAPPVPSGSVVPIGAVRTGVYPEADKVPRTDDPQVLDWLKLVDFSTVPSYPLSNDGNCPAGGIAALNANQCWWTCQKCTRPTDIIQCPTTGQWGLSYDDGPTEFTPSLLNWLDTNSVKSTFFVVGSRCSQHIDLVKQEVAAGHHIAVHTWSHHALTSLTNEQIVAEVKWTEKCIKDAAGVTPVYMRPPYGDVDDRVRAVLLQLGYKIVIWTEGFDTNDWQLSTGAVTVDSVKANFQGWLTKIPTLSNGIIVLEHDLYPQSVDIAVNSILPMAKQANVQMMPIPQCLGDSKPYLEGALTSNLPNGSYMPPATVPMGSNSSRLVSAGSVSEAGISSVASMIIAMMYSLFM